MTLATLAEVLQPAQQQGYALLGVVVLGWEDARAYVAAAELQESPIVLQAGPRCRAHTPLPVLAAMLRHLGENASVPVVLHLDHSTCLQECASALDHGFTSLMYDGSRLPLQENILRTRQVVELAHAAKASVEGEVGFVGYDRGDISEPSQPKDVALFAEQTAVDAVAISIGNVHLRKERASVIDYQTLEAIESLTAIPLVLHGGSGISLSDRHRLATTTKVCKINVGTELRQCFGDSLRGAVQNDPACFDRIAMLEQTEPPLVRRTCELMSNVCSTGRN